MEICNHLNLEMSIVTNIENFFRRVLLFKMNK